MDNTQIEKALARIFDEEGHRIVFWNDPDNEFAIILSLLELPEGVRVIKVDQEGSFKTKVLLEHEDSVGRYIIYSTAEEPDFEDDWLLDIRLYSRSFRADRASIILDQLKLTKQHLRDHIASRRKFFDNKHRLQKLIQITSPDDDDIDLDRKMISVVAKAEHDEWFNIIRTIFHSYTEVNNSAEVDLDTPPETWTNVEKFDLDKAFWQMAKTMFGYSEETPCLKNFLIRLMVTDFAQHCRGIIPVSLSHLVLPQAGRNNAVVCLAQWRDSTTKGISYDCLSGIVADFFRLEDQVYERELEDLMDVMTFQVLEKHIAKSLRDRVILDPDLIKIEDIKSIVRHRQAGHWASCNIPSSVYTPRKGFYSVYEAILKTAEFLALKRQYSNGIDFETTEDGYKAYENNLYLFDQLYRQFCEQTDVIETLSWDVLKNLKEYMDACYVNWFLQGLAAAWGKMVDPKGSHRLLSTWKVNGVINQTEFFNKHVESRLAEAERRRSFVIISDALRYEAADELKIELNGKYRFEAEISSMLGVLPSYTALGMAALLPHTKLKYKENGEIFVDEKACAWFEQRNQILASVDGIAVRASELIEMKKEEGRELIKDKRIIYIYHNVIDETGDKATSEGKTFSAVRQTINELAGLVSHVINNLNGNHVIITSDHGFLYTETDPGEPEKTTIIEKPLRVINAKKRYLVGYELGDNDTVWHGSTAITAGAEGGMEFWIPKGLNRFHFVGGARFIHGGAMPQEVVVPVITVRHIKDKSVDKTKVKPVTVHVLGTIHKITTSRHKFDIIQMESVSDRVKPVTLKIAIYDAEEPVTNIESVKFESVSDKIDDRKKTVMLVLQNRKYDKNRQYRLILRDAETGIEQESRNIIIDRAFNDDFQ
ncbi:MAG: BREX-1 system phosphatase PglZ type A [Deltaproteobacteria bacterium]|nr:BREX-1 system phosphatase PglZ type A [Deltaproteobacteria bacterium]